MLFAGALRGGGRDLVEAHASWLPHLVIGARIGVDLPLSARLSVRPHAELLFPLVGARLVDDRQTTELWRSPAINGIFGLDVVLKTR